MSSSFFLKFKRNNNFQYNDNVSALENFENLTSFLNLKYDSKGYLTLYKRYHSSSLDGLRKRKTLESFFEFFNTEFKFPFKISDNDSRNYLAIFKNLSEFMGFDSIYIKEKQDFQSLTKKEKVAYLMSFSQQMNLQWDSKKTSFNQQFEKISKLDSWKFSDKFLHIFNKIISDEVKGRFEKLDDLKKILIRYEFYKNEDEIPNDIPKLKKLIKNELFVNIYDFINKNNKQKFNDIIELSEYTIENKLIYPLELAKETFAYKVLLKKLY